ncbi:MAG: DUF4397 domain-containing protein [Candidatus Marinimicrobia bacterium]|nr:DUF4397 domain-containing protein [Candidatus Neomarinimicrobiota bacterium]
MKNTLLYIFIFISYALSNSVDVRIINTIKESGYNVLIDGELVLAELKSSELKPKPISVPNESIISILNDTELVFEGKLSFKEKAVYDIYIGKSVDANHGYEISLSFVNVLPVINLSDDKPKSISGDLEFNVIEASTILSGSRKHEDLDEGRIQNEVSRVASNDYSAYNSTEVRIINTIPEFGYNILIDGELVFEELKSSDSKSKPIFVPNESIISIFNDIELVYEGKLSFKGKAVYDVYIGKSDDANHGYEISLSAMNILPNVNLSDDKPKEVSSELDFNVIEASPVASRSGKYVPNDETRGMLEVNQVANVQIIHNSPYPVVDIYVDESEALGDIPYRATTALIELPISTVVGIAPANDTVIASFPFTLETDANYVVTASGIIGNSQTPFNLFASSLDVAAIDSNHFALKVFHGATDAPAVDIYANGSMLVENLSYSEYAGYVQVPVGDYTIDVTASGSSVSVASFAAPLTNLGGGTGIVFATGFLSPAANDSTFSLILTTPSGYSVELPSTPTALSTIADNSRIQPKVFALNQNYPNPFNPTTSISFDVFELSNISLNIYDLNGRLVKNLMSGNLSQGTYNISWNGKNANGASVAGGVYLYSITSNNSTIVKKMSLIK